MLAEDAIRSAIRDYRSKRQNLQASGAKSTAGFIDVSQSGSTGETVTGVHPGQAIPA